MEDVLSAVAAAISQTEREAASARREAGRMEREIGGMQGDRRDNPSQ